MFTAAHVLLPCHSRLFYLSNIYRAEILFVVAPATAVTKLPLVNIVPAMAIDTQPVFVTGLLLGSAVAGMAMNIGMRMPEPE